jgi:hypothetical protein
MSKFLYALLLVGCASTSEIRRTIAVDEGMKEHVDAVLEMVQEELYLAPIHVLKEVKWGKMPREELARCHVDEGGMTVVINKGYSQIPEAQLRAAIGAAILRCLTPQQQDAGT